MKFDVATPFTYPVRQVHLDFHTRPDIVDVGSRFSKRNFQKALREGNVASITVFAKCYHGFCYYPTKEGIQHPGIDFDFTGEMINAAHEIGVRAPVYLNVGLSHVDASAHPEWIARKQDGSESKGSYVADEPELLWPNMCLNDGSYCQHIYKIIEEVCCRYQELDGLFLDICFKGGPCLCEECRRGMEGMGLDTENEQDAEEYYRIKHIVFMKKCKKILNRYHPNSTIFFNSGGADINHPEYHPYSTHFEIEDLPTVWGGYDKMPLNAVFFAGTGKFYLGMTGKFHLEWGEFGGFKCKEALRYEVATMAVYGAGCSVGDHLLWDGEMDMETYRNIGYAYRYLERIEPYCYGGTHTASVGIYLSGDVEDNIGISMILLENQIDFGIIQNNEFECFETIIFSGGVVLEENAVRRLEEYIQNGGKVLFAGDSLIKDGVFQIDCGLKNPKKSETGGDYILVSDELDGELPKSPFYSYLSAIRTEKTDAQIIAEVLAPYKDHSEDTFARHRNLPYKKDGERYPGMSKKGNVVYLAHRIPAIYGIYGSIFHKRYFISALRLLEPKFHLQIEIGAQGRCRMIKQAQSQRYCINMTYAAPVKRGKAEIIEDIVPIYDIPVIVDVPEEIVSIYLPLRGKDISFVHTEKGVNFCLDVLECHETIVLEYHSEVGEPD